MTTTMRYCQTMMCVGNFASVYFRSKLCFLHAAARCGRRIYSWNISKLHSPDYQNLVHTVSNCRRYLLFLKRCLATGIPWVGLCAFHTG